MVTVSTPLAVLFVLTLVAAALAGLALVGVASASLTGHHRRRRAAHLSIPAYYRGLAGAH